IRYSTASEPLSEPSRFNVRKKFWQRLLPNITDTDLFSNVNPSKDHWLSAGAGVSGLNFTLVVTKSYVRVELAISTSNKERNKSFFRELLNRKSEIEESFGGSLVWEELQNNKMSRIKVEKKETSVFDEEDWESMNAFVVENLFKF